jgi:hypothetical protein
LRPLSAFRCMDHAEFVGYFCVTNFPTSTICPLSCGSMRLLLPLFLLKHAYSGCFCTILYLKYDSSSVSIPRFQLRHSSFPFPSLIILYLVKIHWRKVKILMSRRSVSWRNVSMGIIETHRKWIRFNGRRRFDASLLEIILGCAFVCTTSLVFEFWSFLLSCI